MLRLTLDEKTYLSTLLTIGSGAIAGFIGWISHGNEGILAITLPVWACTTVFLISKINACPEEPSKKVKVVKKQ